MAKSSYKTKEEAVKAQEKDKKAVVTAKAALTDYLKANKLDRTKDNSKDKKHGKKIKELELAIEKANAALTDSTAAVATFKDKGKEKKSDKKGGAGKKATYDYPAGLTSEEKKKYRQASRKGASPDEALAAAKGEAKAKSSGKKDKKADKASDKKKADSKDSKKYSKSEKTEKTGKK